MPFTLTLLASALLSASIPCPIQDIDPNQQDVDEALAEMIDALAGHPSDPQLPEDVVGASDEVLLATDPREIADLLQLALPFAKDRADSPRFLFALGRAALAHGYEQRGRQLLTEASTRGSVAAFAYLGFIAEVDGDAAKALEHLQSAVAGGFEPPAVIDALAEISRASADDRRFDATSFNKPDWIQALYDGNPAGLHAAGLDGLIYAASIHNTLWANEILFLAEDPAILLDLDPDLAFKITVKMTATASSVGESVSRGGGALVDALLAMAETRRGGGSIMDEVAAVHSATASRVEPTILTQAQGVQDARRLAILYNNNPEAFRRVYSGLREFVYGSVTADPRGFEHRLSTVDPELFRKVTPKALYDQMNEGLSNPNPVVFRVSGSLGYIFGKRSGSERFGLIKVRYDQSVGDSYDLALSVYPHLFKTNADVQAAIQASRYRDEWSPEGPDGNTCALSPAIPRFKSVESPKEALMGRDHVFFCPSKDSVHVIFAYAKGNNVRREAVCAESLYRHLLVVDAAIDADGDFFGRTREEQSARVVAGIPSAAIAMQRWPDLYPTLDAFVDAATKAEIRPELFSQ